MSDPSLTEAVLSLPPADRLELIGILTDSLENNPESVPLTDAQRQDLDRRRLEMEKDPSLGSTWEQVKSRVWPKR
jgi:putative addiction module component (TIGR02574 family)